MATNTPRILSLVVLVWLLIGIIAAGQRGYYTEREQNCATLGTIAVTMLAGPLNYLGVNPKVDNCELPAPSE
ncbi:hypothetical protein BOX37_26130 [Nocardia mangyaensis]|uniref:Uncharacterized protein n=1 Tax=Nocardia mangyaensis TaxID=2213200 RepID=A0A1J0VXV3_9NOCA|nr:hypothetical protein [Nocardia mangyaensis]APE36833.1 hypothetical protein BOX37_26130 [Nocardia mangyaensis]